MDIDGTNKVNLTNQTDKINKEPSTFGNKVVYASNDEIYERDLDGSNLLQLTSLLDYGVCSLPKFSPNGTKIGILSNTNRDVKNINNKFHLWVINTDNTNLSIDGVRLTRNTGNVDDYNTLNGVDNYLWSFENSIVYSSYTDTNIRTLYRGYVNHPLVNNRITYGDIDTDLLGIMKNKLDKLTSNRSSGVIYYLYEGKVISYDIDYDLTQELTGN